jgi:hypothetical protein
MISALRMFDTLWAPGQHSLCTQTNGHPFRSTGFYDNPKDLIRAAAKLPDESNVWWGVHGMEPPARGRGGVNDVVAVTTLAADFDWSDPDAHKGTALPTEAEVRDAVGRMPRPTVVVNSGHGLQAYWGLVDTLDRIEGEHLSDGFFRWIEAEFGLHNDRTDLASVLRLPGTLNNKSRPVPVVIEYVDRFAGYQAAFLREHHWLPLERSSPSVPVPTSTLSITALVGGTHDDVQPYEWLNQTFDSTAALGRLGWVEGSRHGDEIQFTRPGKDPRHGTSATLHVDTGAVNIYSTALDPIYAQVGLAGRGCVTLKPADLWMVENRITDRSDASRTIRALMPQRSGPRPTLGPDPAAGVDADQVAPTSLNLPDEFWTQRPWLAHIRQAAHCRGASADAVLGAVIARYATIVPPMYQIPPIVMTGATFDHISVLVAESGGGKSGAMGIAAELFPGPLQRADIVWRLPTPSGEGLVAAFFEMVEKEVNGKKERVNAKTKTAVHFAVDEALALVETSNRQGTTIGAVLCTAWSGGDPGQANASSDRKRVGMDRWTYRMSGVASIQLSLGHRLLEDTFVHQGLSGRLVFFAAEDPGVTHWRERPEWPGELDLPIHPTMPLVMEYARSIEETVLDDHHQRVTKQRVIAPIDSHLNLVRLKLSGLFALMDGRTAVTDSDWSLADTAVASHLALRGQMLAMRRQANYEKTVTAATAQATFEDVRDETRERKALAKLRDSIIRHVPEEGITRAPLRRATTSATTKHRFDMALAKALEDRAIKLVDERYYTT